MSCLAAGTGAARFAPRLVIMAKEPRAGRVKTRLGHEIGMVRAAWWYRHRLSALAREVQSPLWQTVIAVAPDSAVASPALPEVPRVGQGRGDLGARMARLFRTLPPGPVVIIGSDIPGISRGYIRFAFQELGRHDAVLGPAPDGGYWGIGLRRIQRGPKGILRSVRWSSRHALNDTLATMPNLRIAMLPVLADVDDASDLARISR